MIPQVADGGLGDNDRPHQYVGNGSDGSAEFQFTVTWTETGVEEVLILLSGSAIPASLGMFALPPGGLALLPAVPAAVPPKQPTSSLIVTGLKGAVSAMISPESSELKTFLPMLVAGGQANYGAFAPSITFVRLPVIQ